MKYRIGRPWKQGIPQKNKPNQKKKAGKNEKQCYNVDPIGNILPRPFPPLCSGRIDSFFKIKTHLVDGGDAVEDDELVEAVDEAEDRVEAEEGWWYRPELLLL